MGRSGVQEWRFGARLHSDAVERWLTDLPGGTSHVVLKLGGKWDAIGPFADFALQGGLCLLQRRGIRTTAVVPPLTLTGERPAHILRDHPRIDDSPRYPITPVESVLTSTVAGLVVGQLCEFDAEHRHISGLQRDWLRRRNWIYGFGHDRALAVVTDESSTRRRRRDFNAWLENRMGELLGRLNFRFAGLRYRDASGWSADPSGWFADLQTFSFEAFDNTGLHGRWTLGGRPIRSVQFARVQRLNVGSVWLDPQRLAPNGGSALREYLDRLAKHDEIAGRPWRNKRSELVELTIGDGGVGVAARMNGSLAVYEGDLADEKAEMLRALRPEGTSQSGVAGAGKGFSKMLRACHRLRGFLVIRTGRLNLTQTYLDPEGMLSHVDFRDRQGEAYRVDVNAEPLPLLAGTSVSLLFPDRPISTAKVAGS